MTDPKPAAAVDLEALKRAAEAATPGPWQCPDCGRTTVSADNAEGGTVASHCFAHRKGDFLGERLCKDSTIARLRLELANALSIANSRTYCMDSPEVLKARVGELEEELAEAWRAGYDAALAKTSPVHEAAEAHWLALALEDTGKRLASTASEFAGDNPIALKMTRAFATTFAAGIAEMAAAEHEHARELLAALPEPMNPYKASP